MDLDSADAWRWIWLIAAAVFAIAELAVPGTFFMVSFAAGAIAAAIVSFAGMDPVGGWIVFVSVTAVALVLLLPLGRRINQGQQEGGSGVGSDRWAGRTAVVIDDIPGGVHSTGMVRIEREDWRAESVDGAPVGAGTEVQVLRVDGTRLVVAPVDAPA
jgi:membrane protein implicated in regulation of membrane protease activity